LLYFILLFHMASSDVDGDALTFAWILESQHVGSSPTLINATHVLPTLTVDEPGDDLVHHAIQFYSQLIFAVNGIPRQRNRWAMLTVQNYTL
jgi:hypothetical protein